ncbi:hypothetical protein [Streptomyces pseudovenezuelae]|uniref:hypothetical protein n=1 Tax=Streptomyces pseudovenezuelae TaxID=67350 RepID=UPI002474DF7E|nr:hypothetical protein [Streptomyces pseudovenezuelae]
MDRHDWDAIPRGCGRTARHLADGTNSGQEKEILRLFLLLGFVAGEVDGDSVEDSLQARCLVTVRDGLWLVCRALVDAPGPEARGYADDILGHRREGSGEAPVVLSLSRGAEVLTG